MFRTYVRSYGKLYSCETGIRVFVMAGLARAFLAFTRRYSSDQENNFTFCLILSKYPPRLAGMSRCAVGAFTQNFFFYCLEMAEMWRKIIFGYDFFYFSLDSDIDENAIATKVHRKFVLVPRYLYFQTELDYIDFLSRLQTSNWKIF